jgi:hemolysin III
MSKFCHNSGPGRDLQRDNADTGRVTDTTGHDIRRWMLGRMQNPIRGFLHGTSAVVFGVGAVLLWLRGSGDLSRQIALLTFALSLVALYTVSSLYHSIPWRERWKKRMQRLDHSMIYALVAGTYTPIAVIVLSGWLQWAVLATVWGIVFVGALQKAFLPNLRDGYSIALQTTQGWLALLLLVPLAQRLPGPALLLAALGGLLYTVGMVVLVTKRPRLWPRTFSYHELFHVFVVAGSSAHYAMTFWYVAQFPSA